MKHETSLENVIVIGGGPAGLAAALYLSRAGLKPLLFGGSPYGGQLMLTSEIENFPGFESILGSELIDKMRKQVTKFGTRIVDQNVLSVDLKLKPFTVKSLDKEFKTKAIIIAMGAKALWLGLESETRLRGKGVSACATCDGFFFRGKEIAVVGGGDTAMEEALTLTKFASKVYLIHRRNEFRASRIMRDRVLNHEKIEVIYNTKVDEVLGEQKVEGVKLSSVGEGGRSGDLAIQGLFIAIGHKPDTDLVKDLVVVDEKGYIVTHKEQIYSSLTSVPGVFAAGDCVDHIYRQAATAAGMGVAAALDVERYLELSV